jgi:Transposase DDE domain
MHLGGLWELVAGQDVEPAEGSDGRDGRWRIARKVAPDRLSSTVDPDTRHAHKTQHKRQDGFKAHIVIEPDTGLITATRLTKTNGSDNSDANVGIDQSGLEMLGDSAYGTGEMLAALDKVGYLPVIKPWPLTCAVEGRFGIDDFTYDADAGTLTCPNGVTRALSPKRNVIFGIACRGCPLRDRCTTSKTGRTIKVHKHEALQRAHRIRAKDDEFKTVYRTHRPMVERSIAWLTRGNGRVPFCGVAKNNDWPHNRAAGLNLRRLINLGLAHSDIGWALAKG